MADQTPNAPYNITPIDRWAEHVYKKQLFDAKQLHTKGALLSVSEAPDGDGNITVTLYFSRSWKKTMELHAQAAEALEPLGFTGWSKAGGSPVSLSGPGYYLKEFEGDFLGPHILLEGPHRRTLSATLTPEQMKEAATILENLTKQERSVSA